MESLEKILICPNCRATLDKDAGETRACSKCSFTFEKKDGVLVSGEILAEKDKEFYDHIYSGELGEHWFQGLNRNNILKQILEKISLAYRRERFFKRNIKGRNNLVLDIACGAGRDYFTKYGKIIGIDLSFDALAIAKKGYDLVIQGGVNKLPFSDNTFDYVVSSDFFGHIRSEDKDQIMKEIHRVLKPGGKTVHIIENDSNNRWFRFAHRYPELFQKYFIEKIGGHIGLELPSACVERWKKNGFEPVIVKKIWGVIWPIQSYVELFDNEYKAHSVLVKGVVAISKFLSRIKVIRLLCDVVLNPINSLVESLTRLDHGQGLMIVCQKKK